MSDSYNDLDQRQDDNLGNDIGNAVQGARDAKNTVDNIKNAPKNVKAAGARAKKLGKNAVSGVKKAGQVLLKAGRAIWSALAFLFSPAGIPVWIAIGILIIAYLVSKVNFLSNFMGEEISINSDANHERPSIQAVNDSAQRKLLRHSYLDRMSENLAYNTKKLEEATNNGQTEWAKYYKQKVEETKEAVDHFRLGYKKYSDYTREEVYDVREISQKEQQVIDAGLKKNRDKENRMEIPFDEILKYIELENASYAWTYPKAQISMSEIHKKVMMIYNNIYKKRNKVNRHYVVKNINDDILDEFYTDITNVDALDSVMLSEIGITTDELISEAEKVFDKDAREICKAIYSYELSGDETKVTGLVGIGTLGYLHKWAETENIETVNKQLKEWLDRAHVELIDRYVNNLKIIQVVDARYQNMSPDKFIKKADGTYDPEIYCFNSDGSTTIYKNKFTMGMLKEVAEEYPKFEYVNPNYDKDWNGAELDYEETQVQNMRKKGMYFTGNINATPKYEEKYYDLQVSEYGNRLKYQFLAQLNVAKGAQSSDADARITSNTVMKAIKAIMPYYKYVYPTSNIASVHNPFFESQLNKDGAYTLSHPDYPNGYANIDEEEYKTNYLINRYNLNRASEMNKLEDEIRADLDQTEEKGMNVNLKLKDSQHIKSTIDFGNLKSELKKFASQVVPANAGYYSARNHDLVEAQDKSKYVRGYRFHKDTSEPQKSVSGWEESYKVIRVKEHEYIQYEYSTDSDYKEAFEVEKPAGYSQYSDSTSVKESTKDRYTTRAEDGTTINTFNNRVPGSNKLTIEREITLEQPKVVKVMESDILETKKYDYSISESPESTKEEGYAGELITEGSSVTYEYHTRKVKFRKKIGTKQNGDPKYDKKTRTAGPKLVKTTYHNVLKKEWQRDGGSGTLISQVETEEN